jgi:hypothetical protein
VPRASAFRVVYKVDDTVGPTAEISTDVIQVQQPWNSRLEHRDGPPPGGEVSSGNVQNQRFTFNVARGSTGFATRRIPGPLTTSPSPEALEAAAGAGLVDRLGEASVAGEACTRWAYKATDQILAKPTAEEGVEACITRDGIPLREAISLKGRVVRLAEAVQVDRNPPAAADTFDSQRDPSQDGDKGLLETEQLVTEEKRSGKDIVTVTPPEGFKASRQVTVVRQAGPNSPPISLYVQAFEQAGDLVTTEQLTTPGNPPWSAEEGDPVMNLGGKRSGRIVYRTGWAEVRMSIEGKAVRVAAPRPAVALAVAKALELALTTSERKYCTLVKQFGSKMPTVPKDAEPEQFTAQMSGSLAKNTGYFNDLLKAAPAEIKPDVEKAISTLQRVAGGDITAYEGLDLTKADEWEEAHCNR